jgi:sugar phosphate isomerase/epimerase
MIKSGLVSVSFRNKEVDEIISLIKKANLSCIEWGGDVHVPHGDTNKAKEVYQKTIDAGLIVAAYGSYYKAGESEESGLSFERVLSSAKELHAPTIRVWAGNRDSKDADLNYREKVVNDLLRIANISEKENISISLEYHVHTLTDSDESTKKLMEDAKDKNILFYWQPPVNLSVEECKKGLKTVLPRLSNVHVYHWTYENGEYIRFPLIDGYANWSEYFRIIKEFKKDHFAMLEFIKNDSEEQLIEDAKILNKLITE